MKRRTILKGIGASGIVGVAGSASARHTRIEDASKLSLEIDGEQHVVDMPDDVSGGTLDVTIDGVTHGVTLSDCCTAECCYDCTCSTCCACDWDC
jgi:hypothetical protein